MISAQSSWYVPAGNSFGRVPGTTTARGGTAPRCSTGSAPVTSMIGTLAVSETFADEHRAGADAHALGDDAARAEEGAVLDDHRRRVRRLEHAADADAAREVHVGADLRARADRRPGVDHRPRPDPGADVHVAGHQHDALGEERAVAGDARRDDPDAVRRHLLQRDLVLEGERADRHRLDLAQAEVLEDRLLRLDVDDPVVAVRRGDAALAAVERRDDLERELGRHSTRSRISTARAHSSSEGTSATRK